MTFISDFFQKKAIFGFKNHQNKFNQLWKRSLLGLGFDVCATMPSAMQHLVLPSITSLKGSLQYFRYSLSGTTIKITYLPAKCHSGVKTLWKLHFNFERSKIDTVPKKLKVRQSRNDFFKPTFLSKNERTNSTLLL